LTERRAAGPGPGSHPSVESALLTDRGRARPVNEDCFAFLENENIAIVADGAGGHRHGNRASRIAVETVEDCYFTAAERPLMRSARWVPRSLDGKARRLLAAIQLANYRLFRINAAENGASEAFKDKMAAAFCALSVREGICVVAHVGDVRAYRLRAGQLDRLTADHLSLHKTEKDGQVVYQDYLNRVLGIEPSVRIDLNITECRTGDLFLVCPDGLHRMLSESEVLAGLESARRDLHAGARGLIDRANANGGADNITVALTAFRGPDPHRDRIRTGFTSIDPPKAERGLDHALDRIYGSL
jgi:PPM family protein phosphatase